MARIAANAPFTNQGRADLRRVPTAPQSNYNQNGNSSVSVVDSGLLSKKDGGFSVPAFSPNVVDASGPRARVLCVFLWMTDRLTAVSAQQLYSGPVYPQSTETGTLPSGTDLCTCANAAPTNGMAGLPVGAACTILPSVEVGAQAVLTFGAGLGALAVRGTPLLVSCKNNDFYGPGSETQTAALVELRISALSESILSGKPSAVFLAPDLTTGAFDPYASPSVARLQCILDAAEYIAGQYWLADNTLTDGAVVYDIVGVFTAPVPPASLSVL